MPRFGSRDVGTEEHRHERISPPERDHDPSGRMPSNDSRATIQKKQRRKLVRRSSTGSSGLNAASREASAGGESAAVPMH